MVVDVDRDGAGFQCSDAVFSPLASAEATLAKDEKELGVALIDIGGGKTDILVYADGGVSYSAVMSSSRKPAASAASQIASVKRAGSVKLPVP